MDMGGLLETIFALFGVVLVGYVINKLGILNEKINSGITALIVKVTCPALIIHSVCVENTHGDPEKVWLLLFVGVVLYVFYILIAKIIVIPFRLPIADASVYEMMLVFSNNTFMGYPLVKVLYGDTALFYMSLIHMPFNLLIYTYGVYLANRNVNHHVQIKMGDLLTPGLISSILALIIYLSGFSISKPIVKILELTSGPTTMLSMLMIGSSLAMISFHGIFREYKLFFLTVIRLIVMPVCVYFIANRFLSDQVIIGLLTLSAGLPSSTMAGMIVTQYHGNVEVSSLGIVMTTFCSIMSIPLIVHWFLG